MLFHEMRLSYENNELSANNKYKGNRYTLVGTFEGASEDGILNVIENEIKVTVGIKDGNTQCYIFCDFNPEEWRDVLSEYNNGDEFIFEGECISWGNWQKCSVIKY